MIRTREIIQGLSYNDLVKENIIPNLLLLIKNLYSY